MRFTRAHTPIPFQEGYAWAALELLFSTIILQLILFLYLPVCVENGDGPTPPLKDSRLSCVSGGPNTSSQRPEQAGTVVHKRYCVYTTK